MIENKKDKLSADEIIDQGSRPDAECDSAPNSSRRREQRRSDERDVAGALDYDETPHGGEERKTQIKKEADHND